jgi:hypothetical protein
VHRSETSFGAHENPEAGRGSEGDRKLRIAYVAHWLDGPNSGVFKKILRQIALWRVRGHEVTVHLLTAAGSPLATADLKGAATEVHAFSGITGRLLASHRLARGVIATKPDLIYCRHTKFIPSFVLLALRGCMVVEINSDDVEESRHGSSKGYWFNLLTRGAQLRACAGMVFPTVELSRRERFQFERKSVVIANGIDLHELPVLPPPTSDRPTITFIGSRGQSWHGIDKVFEIAAHFEQWRFNIIGSDASDFQGVPPNVTLHGVLGRADYERILAETDVGLGSLAVYRNNVTEACTLKVREYLAYGLPTIIAYKETDFPNGAPFLLELPAKAGELDYPAIESFVRTWRGRRVPREAIAHIDVSTKETTRLNFFAELAQQRAKAGPE